VANQALKQKNKPGGSRLEEHASKLTSHPVVNIRSLGVALLYIVTLYLISPPFKLPWITLQEGDYPKESVLAEVDFGLADREATRLAREQAANLAPPVYVLDPESIRAPIADVEDHFNKIEQDALNPVFTPEERAALISKYMSSSTSEETVNLLATLDRDRLDSLRAATRETIGDILGRGVLSDAPGSAKQISLYEKAERKWRVVEVDDLLTLKKTSDALGMLAAEKFPDSTLYQRALVELSLPFIKSTLAFDEELTRETQDEARDATLPVIKSFRKNQEIVQAGHEVTAQDMLELQAHAQALSRANRLQIYLGNAVVLAMIFGCFLLFLYRFRPEIYESNKGLLLIGIFSSFTLATGRLFILLPIPDVWLYLVPVAAGSILLSILVDDRTAFVYAFFISMLYAAQGNYHAPLFLIGIFGSLAGIFYMRAIRRRADIFWPGIVVGVVNVVTIVAFYFIGDIREEFLAAIFAGAANGLITAIGIVPGSLIPLEWMLGIVTNIRLLELSDLNHPLLKRMAMQAPGTYHHSLMVGNMAEAAAEEIGANSLLARVGSYYHDVGKMNKPLYFSENQRGAKNKHDELTPSMSALILTAHAKEGVELAREHRLNQPIVDFIEQHHGTSLMPFFYQKAMEQDPNHAVGEENFRYSGPKPQSREIAICMLADSVEAASRTLTNPTHGRIKAMVEKIINNKFIDSQLNECNLTLKDMHAIADSFVRVLAGYLHSRIEYPEEQTAPEIKEKFEGTDTKVGAKTGNKGRADQGSD